MDRSGLMWIGVAVAALVFLDVLFVELRRCAREAKRIGARLQGYAELPIFSLIAVAEHDVDRIAQASEDIPRLLERAAVAIATLRSYLPKGMSPG